LESGKAVANVARASRVAQMPHWTLVAIPMRQKISLNPAKPFHRSGYSEGIGCARVLD
jgi:hypothetical protein